MEKLEGIATTHDNYIPDNVLKRLREGLKNTYLEKHYIIDEIDISSSLEIINNRYKKEIDNERNGKN